jgi:hypothetical protein
MPAPIPFPFEPDWSERFRERLSYLTDVLPLLNSDEQRIALRSVPRTMLQFRAFATTAREASYFRSLLWGLGGALVAMPLWPEACRLINNVNPGNIYLPVDDVSYRRFESAGYALLWRDPFTCELREVETVFGNVVQLVSGLQNPWSGDGRTRVIPALPGKLESRLVSQRISREAEAMNEIIFDAQEGSPDVTS